MTPEFVALMPSGYTPLDCAGLSLSNEGGGAPIKWEVNDCGEQTANRASDRGRDSPMCVEADFDTKDPAALVLSAGGEGGIRTPDTLTGMPHFECGGINHSPTSPRHAGL